MKDWYLNSEFKDGEPAGGRITFVWLFAIIGVFVLFLACINFVNLSTARHEKKAKEVGIRKAIGSMKSQLVSQFLCEAFVVVFLALVIALMLVTATLSPFNELAEKSISLPYKNIYFWIAIFIFLTVTAFLSGSIRFLPFLFGHGQSAERIARLGKSSALSRRILVVTQLRFDRFDHRNNCRLSQFDMRRNDPWATTVKDCFKFQTTLISRRTNG